MTGRPQGFFTFVEPGEIDAFQYKAARPHSLSPVASPATVRGTQIASLLTEGVAPPESAQLSSSLPPSLALISISQARRHSPSPHSRSPSPTRSFSVEPTHLDSVTRSILGLPLPSPRYSLAPSHFSTSTSPFDLACPQGLLAFCEEDPVSPQVPSPHPHFRVSADTPPPSRRSTSSKRSSRKLPRPRKASRMLAIASPRNQKGLTTTTSVSGSMVSMHTSPISASSSPALSEGGGRFRTVSRPALPLTAKVQPHHLWNKESAPEWTMGPVEKSLQAGPVVEILKFVFASAKDFAALGMHLIGGFREYLRGTELVVSIGAIYDGLTTDERARVWQLLEAWYGFSHSVDFRLEKRLGNHVLDLTSKLKNTDEANKWKLKLYRMQMGGSANVLEMSSPLEVSSLMDLSTLVLAQQLTVYELSLFERIHPHEFSLCAFNGKSKAEAAPHLSRIAEHFNKLAFWVASRVLSKDTPKERAAVLSSFIKLATKLRSFCNFNTMMAVLSGLGMTPVSRLKQTWALLSSSQSGAYDDLNDLMNPIRNYANYKAALVELSDFRIPYIAASLRDYVLASEGNRPLSDDGGINVQRLSVVGSIVFNLLKHQGAPPPFPEEPNVLNLVATLSHETEDELHQISVAHEPPIHATQETFNDTLARYRLSGSRPL